MARRTGSPIVLVLTGILAVGGCSAASSAPASSASPSVVTAPSSPAPSVTAGAAAAKRPRPGPTPLHRSPAATSPAAEANGFPGTVILGAPTDTSVVLSLMAESDLDVFVEYGSTAGTYPERTATAPLKAGQPLEITLSGLPHDARTVYRIRYRAAGQSEFQAATEQSVRTQRSVGASFTFAVEADPHVDVDGKMQPALFRAALENIGAAQPDFLVDLGDTFLGDKFARSSAELSAQYANVRDYFAIVGPSVPLFLVNGNHEGEDGYLLDGTADNLAVWAADARKAYYPEPAGGDSFYSSAAESVPFIGNRDSYYAWEWGDALFVVLDPYSYTTINPKQSGDMWDWTLGETQYRWLASVLSSSGAAYKFVFSHHMIGDIRGGAEVAGLFEWGGSNRSGAYEFDARRPGWGLPIHQLFVKYGVTIFFQGHDHLYARQEKDGVVYQEVPQPATIGNAQNEAAYRSGVILDSPGSLTVSVTRTGVTVDYVRSSVTAGGLPGSDNGTIVHSYTIPRPSGA